MFNQIQLYPTKTVDLFPKSHIEQWTSQGKQLIFKKGEIITASDKPTKDIYIIKKGDARLFKIHTDGKECVLGLLSPGDFINLTDLFSEKRSGSLCKALSDVAVVAVPKYEVIKVIELNPSLAITLLCYMTVKLQETVEILEQVAYGKVEERLIFLLKKIADVTQEQSRWCPVPVPVTHQDLAGMVASTRETITLLINKLIQLGRIRIHQGRIWIRMEDD